MFFSIKDKSKSANALEAFDKCLVVSEEGVVSVRTETTAGTPSSVTGTLTDSAINTVASKLYQDNEDGTFSMRVYQP